MAFLSQLHNDPDQLLCRGPEPRVHLQRRARRLGADEIDRATAALLQVACDECERPRVRAEVGPGRGRRAEGPKLGRLSPKVRRVYEDDRPRARAR